MPQSRTSRSKRSTPFPLYFLGIIVLLVLLPCALPAVASGATRDVDDNNRGITIGIDLGTSHSCVAVKRDGRVQTISNALGSNLTPSWISFTADGQRLIGDPAKTAFPTNPQNTIFDIKRLLDIPLDNLDTLRSQNHWPFNISTKEGKPFVHIESEDKDYTPQEIIAILFRELKDSASAYLGQNVTEAVFAVPTHFNDAQRHAIREAASLAGLTALRIINEPTAAAIAYGLDHKYPNDINVLVYHLGGGTFDVSVLNVEDGVFEILATIADARLGGNDFDQRVAEHFFQLYKSYTGIDASSNLTSITKMLREVERAKQVISEQMHSTLEVIEFYGDEHFSEVLTRPMFERLNMELFEKSMGYVEQVLKDANLTRENITEVILIGGSTRIPKIQALLAEFFSGTPILSSIQPDEAIAHGAAITGAVTNDAPFLCIMALEISPLTLGIETTGGIFRKVVPRNSVIPLQKRQTFTTVHDNQSTVLIQLYEGEFPSTFKNNLLGKFEFGPIPPAPQGVPQIEVVVEIDVDGILKVIVTDKGTGHSETIIIDRPNERTQDDIDRMILEAEEYTAEEIGYIEGLRSARERLEKKLMQKEELQRKLSEGQSGMEVELWLDPSSSSDPSVMKPPSIMHEEL